MSLFIALCRANGIPARGVAGYIIAGDTILDPATYHNWAEVHLDGNWLLVDPQGGALFADDARYVATTLLGGPGSIAIDADPYEDSGTASWQPWNSAPARAQPALWHEWDSFNLAMAAGIILAHLYLRQVRKSLS